MFDGVIVDKIITLVMTPLALEEFLLIGKSFQVILRNQIG
jgi:hypothetical protein